MKRLFVIYNPRSSRHEDIRAEVLEQVREMPGYVVGKYEVEQTDIDQNALKFAELLVDGDLVLAVGGDATAAIGVNGILRSGKDVTLAVLPYGNFNDLARTLGLKRFMDVFDTEVKVQTLYPLEIVVDGELFRYASCYLTVGMMAEAVKVFEEPKMRQKLRTKAGRLVGSYVKLAKWYFKNRQRRYLPQWKLNDVMQSKEVTDYMAVNGRSVARVMKNEGNCYQNKTFRSGVGELASFWRLGKMMIRSIIKQVPGVETKGDKIEFTQPSTVGVQSEGEYRRLEGVKIIEVKKAKKGFKVLTLGR